MNKFSKLYLLAFAALGLTSCLEDPNIEDQKYGMINLDAYKVVEVPTATKIVSLLIENKPTVVDAVELHLAASEVAAEDIKVTLAVSPNSRYQAANYSFPAGMVVTIPKGSRDASLKMATNPINLNPVDPDSIYFTITKIDQPGYTISGNFGKRFVKVSARNAYEGSYLATGTFTHPVAGPRAINRTKNLITINSSTVETEYADLGGAGYTMWLQVNADNTVTIIPKGAVPATHSQFGENAYDPATKTFTLNYKYPGGGGDRVITEKIKRK